MNYRPDIDIVMAKTSPGNGRCRDSTSKTGAEQNAEDIRNFWHSRGHHGVRVWIEPVQIKSNGRGNGGGQIWVVRTNLVRGMPPA